MSGVPSTLGDGVTVLSDEPRALRVASVSVVICAYTARRWELLCAAADSVLAQDVPVDELLLVVDYNDALYERAAQRYADEPRIEVLRNAHAQGLSGARNTGMDAARAEVVAFLDDDARAESGWSRAMVEHYSESDVGGVGGHAAPQWPIARPTWFPEEFDWVVGCSYIGQPTTVAPVRNFLGCNMSLRREAMTSVGGFDSSVGRIGNTPTGCEETELCIRIRQHTPTTRLLFDPAMRVRHHVSPDRTTVRYFARRCYHEGRSKATVSSLRGSRDALSSERTYATQVLPRAIWRGLVRRETGGLVRVAVVVAGVTLTAVGYVEGRVRTACGSAFR
jgi:GT2 family glycosyltransferase